MVSSPLLVLKECWVAEVALETITLHPSPAQLFRFPHCPLSPSELRSSWMQVSRECKTWDMAPGFLKGQEGAGGHSSQPEPGERALPLSPAETSPSVFFL